MDRTDALARVIWDYMLMKQSPKRADAILALCSIDVRIAEYAADLFLNGLSDLLIFSGGSAHNDDLLKVSWEGSEAEHFAEVAMSKGVPKQKILIENKAQNTGENIRFTHELLKRRGLKVNSLVLVQKPYMERRTYATFMQQWPESDTDIAVTSPPISYDEYFNQTNPKETIINIMVGDLQRIKEYPKLGFQIEQSIPANVWNAFESLVAAGYTGHLMKSS